jgi:hypothetical protein
LIRREKNRAASRSPGAAISDANARRSRLGTARQ